MTTHREKLSAEETGKCKLNHDNKEFYTDCESFADYTLLHGLTIARLADVGEGQTDPDGRTRSTHDCFGRSATLSRVLTPLKHPEWL